MKNNDIKKLIKILTHKGRKDLAALLVNSYGQIEESSQYGSRLFSTISTFLIFAPLANYYKLKQLGSDDQNLILEAVLDIYPISDNAPEIVSVEFRLKDESDNEDDMLVDMVDDRMRVFISYSHFDKEVAGKLKEELDNQGFVSFLAHEDIDPSEEWQTEILTQLKACDVFLPLFTENLKNSNWGGQEVGIAFAERKLIIPLKGGIDPYGFIAKYQALKISNNIDIVIDEIINVIFKKGDRDKAISSLIHSFSKSVSYADANNKVVSIKKFLSFFDDKQIMEIIKAGFENSQIYDEGYNAGPFVRNLLIDRWSKNKSQIVTYLKTASILDGEDVDDLYVQKLINTRFRMNLK